MDWTLPVLPLLALGVIVLWWFRRRRVSRGTGCWNCGADLSTARLYVDSKGRSRCPKCGNEMDVTDVYKLRGE